LTSIETTEDHVIMKIFDQDFIITVIPTAKPIHIDLRKSGIAEINNALITWTVVANPDNATKPEEGEIYYDGYQFNDTLPAGLTYVEDSFKVNDQPPAETCFSLENNQLTYTFPTGVTGSQTLSFQTRINNIAAQNNQNKSFTNIATLTNQTSQDQAKATATVKYRPEWLKKYGSYEIKTHSTTWTIAVNTSNATLVNAVVQDELESGLTLDPATIKLNNQPLSTDSSSTPYYSLENNILKIYLGTITSSQKITFTAALDATPRQSISNSANLTWDQQESSITGDSATGEATVIVGKGNANVGVGFINKAAGTYDYTHNILPWTIRVDQAGQPVTAATVTDIFLYHNDEISSCGQDTFPANLSDYPQYARTKVAKDQKFIPGSLQINGNPAAAEQYTLTEVQISDTVTAQILEIELGDISSLQTIAYNSKLTDKAAYGSNGGNKPYTATNYATLFTQDQRINCNASAKIFRHILEKDTASAYNYQDRTVTWQLHINPYQLSIDAGVIT
ncbi:MAG: hypothetical protein RR332_02370, partial [Clostridiales bacterium]